MKRFKINAKQAQQRIANNLGKIAVESLLFSIILIIGVLFLVTNIVRSIATSRSNYSTFLEEKDSLAQIKAVNEELKNEYEYVSSDDFKKLILRDTLGVAEQDETLYKTKTKAKYYDEVVDTLKLRDKTDFTDWWLMLLKF